MKPEERVRFVQHPISDGWFVIKVFYRNDWWSIAHTRNAANGRADSEYVVKAIREAVLEERERGAAIAEKRGVPWVAEEIRRNER